MLRGLLLLSFYLQISPCLLSKAESRTEAYMRCDISRYQACTIDDSSYMSPIRPSRALGLTCSSSCTFSSRRSCQSCVFPVLSFHLFFLWNAIMKSTKHSLGETRLFSFTDVFSIQGKSVGMEGDWRLPTGRLFQVGRKPAQTSTTWHRKIKIGGFCFERLTWFTELLYNVKTIN